jgi:hypothetical protein
MSRHPVDPSRRGGRSPGSDPDIAAIDYARGYTAGYARGAGGGRPPRKTGCPLTALMLLPLLPLLLLVLAAAQAAGWSLGRRNPEHQPDRPVTDWLHDRTDGAEPARRHTTDIPDDQLDGWRLGSRPGRA